MLLNEIYDKLAEEWQMTSEEVQNAIYKEWYKKYHESDKPQAPSSKRLTAGTGQYRIILKGIIMNDTQLKRIADALEEILRLVKADQEKMAKRFPDEDKE